MTRMILPSIDTVREQAVIVQAEWMLEQMCTEEQRAGYDRLFKQRPAGLKNVDLTTAFSLIHRTVVDNQNKGVKPEPVRKIDDPIRRTDEELRQSLEWAQGRKRQKPWFPDNDSPKMLVTCNSHIAIIEELLELRAYKARERVRH